MPVHSSSAPASRRRRYGFGLVLGGVWVHKCAGFLGPALRQNAHRPSYRGESCSRGRQLFSLELGGQRDVLMDFGFGLNGAWEKPPAVPAQDNYRDRDTIEELTGFVYEALNERKAGMWKGLWLEDDTIMFYAGDGNMTRGHADVMDMLRKMKLQEKQLDPSKQGLRVHPTVEVSNIRVVINGMHAWATCTEVWTRGVTKDMEPPQESFVGTNVFRKFNGEWRLMMHWSGRLAPIREQVESLTQMNERKKEAVESARRRGGAMNPEEAFQQGMMMGLMGEELDLEDIEALMEDDDGTVEEVLGNANIIEVEDVSDGGEVWTVEQGEAEGVEGGLPEGAMLDPRSFEIRKKTKKALAAVRRMHRDGRITRQEKQRLIFSVIQSAAQDEISQVETAYDLLAKHGSGEDDSVTDSNEFVDQLKMIASTV